MLAGFGATGAIAGFLVGGVIASTLALWLMVRVFMLRVRGPMQWPALKMAGGMFGALTGMALLLNLDIIALKLVSGADRALVGQYQAAIVLANTPYYLAAALLPIFFTQAAHLGDIVRTSRLVGDALRLALLVLIPIELVFVAAPEQVLAMLFPATYAASATPLRILALGNCALIVVAIFSSVFQATDKARVPASILIGVAVSEVIALGLVVPTWHAAGAALTFLIAATCALAILLSIYTITVKGAVLRPAMRWLIRYGSALGLGTLVGLMALRLEHGTVGALILGGLSYGVCALCLRLLAMPGLSSGLYPLSQVSITEKDDSCVSSI